VNDLTDQKLLRAYAANRSESAFAELVRRHVNLVYSAALRMVGDADLARDVTQNTFVALARNARRLTVRPVLSGWLHRTARNLAVKVVRSDARRRAREQEAAAMNEILSAEPDASDALWIEIAPQLDSALDDLNEADRDALLLRYFEGNSAREMAQRLGVSEQAAQKRVSRAVERLRVIFSRRGVTVGANGLVAIISAKAIQAAPAGLGAAISTASLAGVATASATSMSVLAFMNTTKVKVGIAGVIVATGIAIPLMVLLQQKAELSRENLALRHQVERAGEPAAASEDPAAHLTPLTTSQFSELLRLRGEVGRLRAPLRDVPAPPANASSPPEAEEAPPANQPRMLTASVQARVPEGQTLITGGWISGQGKRSFVLMTPSIHATENQPGQITLQSLIFEMTDEALASAGLNEFTTDAAESTLAGLYTREEANDLMRILEQSEGVNILSAPRISTHNGTQASVSTGGPDIIGPAIEILPEIAPGGDAVDIVLGAAIPASRK
jgi:RNA polymerase sigma factor (sigma-70 family)